MLSALSQTDKTNIKCKTHHKNCEEKKQTLTFTNVYILQHEFCTPTLSWYKFACMIIDAKIKNSKKMKENISQVHFSCCVYCM